MPSAYTPGLTVSGDVVVRRVRRLPIKGEVRVSPGDRVRHDTVVAGARLPGVLQTIRIAERLGIDPKDVPAAVLVRPGDPIGREGLVAETKGVFGLFRQRIVSDFAGTVEAVSDVTGSILVREASTPIEVDAYLDGTVVEVMPEEGAVVETRGAMVQGIFGVGGERQGTIRMAVASPDEPLGPQHVRDEDAGAILVGGSGLTREAIVRAAEVGAVGLVAGGVRDDDLVGYLGYDIGVAITGDEAIPLSILVTEGFGFLAMADRTFGLLRSLEGMAASLNGATQIRAGVIRPEIVVPRSGAPATPPDAASFELTVGASIRCVREPYFGRLGTVTALPPALVALASGAEVRVLRARLDDGEEAVVPRANVEIVAGSG